MAMHAQPSLNGLNLCRYRKLAEMIRTLLSLPACLAGLLLLSACATDRTYGTSPGIIATQLEELPPQTGGARYLIGSQESLEIEVVSAEELSGTYLTDESGNLAFPFIGNVALSGKSPSEAGRLIEAGLRGSYILNPQVRVIPVDFPPPSISVGGQVQRPGAYPAIGSTTLLRAVNQAGGTTEYAKLTDVLILREVDDTQYIGLYDMEAIQRGNYADPRLYPDDIVLVGDSPERRRIDSLLQVIPPFLTATAIILQNTTN